jgi:hypothetical protein
MNLFKIKQYFLLLFILGFCLQGQGQTYCTPTVSSSDATGITRVIFNDLDYSDADNTNTDIEDFTATQTANIQLGLSYNFSVYVNTEGSYTSHTFVWIDWNDDGTFNTTDEQYDCGDASAETNGISNIIPNISVPVTASTGTTRMRVASKFNTDPSSCSNTGYGEYEDYAVVIASLNDATSTIATSATLSEPATISSLVDTDGEKLSVFDFTLADPGSGDALSTIIDALIIEQGSINAVADWTTVIAGAWIDGPDQADLAGTVNPSNITFSLNDMITIADGGASETYTLKIRLSTSMTPAATIDGDLLEFKIHDGSITEDAAGSSFGAAQDLESGDGGLAIDVDATKLLFVQQPTNTSANSTMSPSVEVEVTDVNGHRDADFAAGITLTSTGTMTVTSPVSATSGLSSFSDIVHSVAETTRSITSTSSGLTSGISTNFDITPQIILISDGGTVNTCDATFYDSGGAGSDYGNGESSQIIICPNVANAQTIVTFSAYDSEDNYDGLRVFDANTATNQITTNTDGAFSGSCNAPAYTNSFNPVTSPTTFTSSHASGCLTFSFCSDGTGLRSGWVASVSCNILSDSDSKIEASATLLEPATISSLVDTEAEKIEVFDFTLTDLGTTDVLTTIFDQIQITKGTGDDVADWSTVIDGAYLNGFGLANEVGTIAASTITFSGDDFVSIANGTDETYTLSIWLKPNMTGIVDGDNLVFNVSDVSTTEDASGSQLGTYSVESGAAKCAITIVATELRFDQEPSNACTNVGMSPSVTVEATDENGNRDIDITSNIRITSSGTLTGSPVEVAAISGLATFNALTHTVSGTGLTLNAERGTPNLDWDKASTTFDIGGAPAVTTQAVSLIATTTATGNGNVTSVGGGLVTQHGVCWNTGGAPTTADSKTTDGAAGTGAYTSSITGLTPGQIYYVKTYATNSCGTSYGAEVSFVAANASSDIVTGNNEMADIDYNAKTAASITGTGDAHQIWSFTIRDGGAGSDADAEPTELTDITIIPGASDGVTGGNSWASTIKQAALYDGATELAEITVAGETMVFSGFSSSATDNGSKTLDLYLTFETGTVIDQEQFQFEITNANTTAGTGSGFTAFSAVTSSVTGENNKVDVIATKLVYSSAPPATSMINTDFTATVQAQDVNNNLDTDASGTVTISEGGIGNISSVLDADLTSSFSSGQIAWTDLQYDTEENTVIITASHSTYTSVNNGAPGTDFFNATVVTVGSSGFDYTSIQSAYDAIKTIPAGTPYIIELQLNYNTSTEGNDGDATDGILLGSNSATSINTITIRPESTVSSAIEIKYNPYNATNHYYSNSITTAYLMTFDQADYVIIDGRPGGLGSDKFITIENTANPSTEDAGAVIVFEDDATNNTIKYCNIYGETEYNGGSEVGLITYWMDASSSPTGNDNNDIDNCIVADRPSGTTAEPWTGISLSNWTGTVPVNDIDITNCEFKNILGNDVGVTKTDHVGYISIMGTVTDLIIDNNSFYSEIDLDDDSGKDKGFIVNKTSYTLTNLTITNNSFGSKTADGTGAELLINGDGNPFYCVKIGAGNVAGNLDISGNSFVKMEKQDAGSFYPIWIENRSLTSTVTIDGNTIQAIDQSGDGEFIGIYYDDVGLGGTPTLSITNNTMDDLDLLGDSPSTSVADRTSAASSNYMLISSDTDDESDVEITNNTFTDLYVDTDSNTDELFYFDNNNELDFSHNTIGDTLVEHDIDIHVDSRVDILRMHGSASVFTVDSNEFAEINWSIDNENDGAGYQYNGGAVISIMSGAVTLNASDNSIHDMDYAYDTDNGSEHGDYAGHLKGIEIGDASATGTINHNEIYNFFNGMDTYEGTGASNMTGIDVAGDFNITKNIIYGFTGNRPMWDSDPSQSFYGGQCNVFTGIFVQTTSAATTIYNNVALFSSDGDENLTGISNSGDNTKIHHNTIKISGSMTVKKGTPNNYETDFKGLECTSSATGILIYNNNIQNIFGLDGIGNGEYRCLDIGLSSYTADYNAYDYGNDNALNNKDSTDWKATGDDANAVFYKTTSGTTGITIDAKGYVTSASWRGTSTGDNLSTTVSADRNSSVRPVAPWMGAYESAATALPVKYINFTAKQVANQNELNWQTATEINALCFIIEASSDATTFSRIDSIPANGNSNSVRTYLGRDDNPLELTYYRLKQIDFNGAFEYSNIVAVHRTRAGINSFSYYPNPFNEEITISLNTSEETMGWIRVRDLSGRVVLEESTDVSKHTLSMNSCAKGVYLIQIHVNGENHFNKIIKR